MKLLFPKQNYNFLSPSSNTHIFVTDLYISRIGLLILLQENRWTYPGKIAHRHMNVEIGTVAEPFPEKEYLNGILVAVAATPWLTGGGVACLLSLCLSLGYNYVIPIIRA